jgi:hypothetical protein
MNNGDTQVDRIDRNKVRELTRALEARVNSPHYVIGWLESMIASVDSPVRLTKKQVKAFNEMLDDNIRWASETK